MQEVFARWFSGITQSAWTHIECVMYVSIASFSLAWVVLTASPLSSAVYKVVWAGFSLSR